MNIRKCHFSSLATAIVLMMSFILMACWSDRQSSGPYSASKSFKPAIDDARKLNDSNTQCSEKIRRQMEKREIRFQPVASLSSGIAAAEAALPRLDAIQYGIDKASQINSLDVQYSHSDQNSHESFDYGINVANSNSESPLVLILTYRKMNADSVFEIDQHFNVGEDCAFKLQSTSQETIQRNASGWQVQQTSYYADGTSQTKSDSFTVPAGMPLLNVLSSFDKGNLLSSTQQAAFYEDELGVVIFTFGSTQNKSLQAFGLTLNVVGSDIEIEAKGKKINTIFFGADEAKNVSAKINGPTTSFVVPQEIFEAAHLGTARNDTATFEYKLGQGYLKGHDTFRLVADEQPSYDHFQAYYRITNVTKDPQTGKLSMTLTENADATIADQAKPEDLASNATIQTDLPQIQAIASEIRAAAPDSRVDQIRGILNYLASHYKYDQDMLKNNIVHTLSTSEALAAGKGVCQHYSVLFVSLARALKIPSRIVVGLNFDDKSAGYHAWVEAEVQPGLWRAIEPQDKDSLERFYARLYFPQTRGLALEDSSNRDASADIAAAMNQSQIFEPL